MAWLLFRMFRVDRIEFRGTMHGVQVQLVMGELKTELGMQIQLLFIAGGKDNAVDEDVDEQPIQDLALIMDNVFQADDCDAFDSDVDEAPTAHTMFMENLSFTDPVYDEAGPSYDSDILSKVYDHDHYQDVVCEHHEDLLKMKEEALKEQTTASRPIKALTVYPPNTPATLVPRETDTQEKDKNKAKNDKTKHRMEKIRKDKVIRSRKSKVKARGQQKSTPGKSKVYPDNVKVKPDKAKAEKTKKIQFKGQKMLNL
nr:integrase, catalytic region, zinc finger, CCHC-type, peptidase aspartic, catalytic [Tanacetum cinerariifolium]